MLASRRGLIIVLPTDFLRPPGWKPPSQQELADEQLAMMLQNAMFQREIQQVLHPSEVVLLRAQQRRRLEEQQRRQQQPREPREPGEMSKMLQDLGDGVKQKLHDIAARFRSAREGGPAGAQRLPDNDDESAGLMGTGVQDDDDEEEVIEFGNSESLPAANDSQVEGGDLQRRHAAGL